MGYLDLLSECEKVFESLKHVIIRYYYCFNFGMLLNFRSCGGDKRAVNKKITIYILFRKIDS